MLADRGDALPVSALPVDGTFPTAAEETCSVAIAEIDTLPRAEATDDPIERADVLDNANAALATMLVQLQPIVPDEPPLAQEAKWLEWEAMGEWLEDWDLHLQDRQDYAAALREDPKARFTETAKANRQVSRAIDGYAQVNRMPSCETPGDVG